MNLLPALASVNTVLDRKPSSKTLAPSTQFQLIDWFILLLIIGALAFFLMLWAKYLRKPKRRRSHSSGRKVLSRSHHHRHRSRTAALEPDPEEATDLTPSETDDESDELAHRLRYKYRYRRRTHRSRNPTLAETGGLPPIRTAEEQHRLNP